MQHGEGPLRTASRRSPRRAARVAPLADARYRTCARVGVWPRRRAAGGGRRVAAVARVDARGSNAARGKPTGRHPAMDATAAAARAAAVACRRRGRAAVGVLPRAAAARRLEHVARTRRCAGRRAGRARGWRGARCAGQPTGGASALAWRRRPARRPGRRRDARRHRVAPPRGRRGVAAVDGAATAAARCTLRGRCRGDARCAGAAWRLGAMARALRRVFSRGAAAEQVCPVDAHSRAHHRTCTCTCKC